MSYLNNFASATTPYPYACRINFLSVHLENTIHFLPALLIIIILNYPPNTTTKLDYITTVSLYCIFLVLAFFYLTQAQLYNFKYSSDSTLV